VVVNHCERPMTLTAIRETIRRADELDLLTFACADTLEEARAIAQFHPDIINTEESSLIGTGMVSSESYVRESIRAVKDVDPSIIVEQAAGIIDGRQVYDLIASGVEATGSASGIFKAADPYAKIEEMISAAARARSKLTGCRINTT